MSVRRAAQELRTFADKSGLTMTFSVPGRTPVTIAPAGEAIPARFDAKCAACGDPIHEGDPIVDGDGDWIHEECA